MFSNLDELICTSIREGFPSSQVIIQYQKKIVKHRTYGFSSILPVINVATNKTIYDVASLTKIFSIVYAYQYLVEKREISLHQTLGELFDKSLLDRDKKSITLKMLLSHQAGFEPNPLFYDEVYSRELYCQNRNEFLPILLESPIIHKPGSYSLYSDVDYMLLTFILEKIVGERIDQWLLRYFWQELRLENTTYAPLRHDRDIKSIAATELHGNTRDNFLNFHDVRQDVIWGEVQDEKAYHCMDEYSGHAGLFSNSGDLLTLLNLMTEESGYFSNKTKTLFLNESKINPTFGLGWRLNRGKMEFMFGDYASSFAYGHTGWTGCLAMHDPQYDLSIIYLTNRKHTKVINPQKNQHLFYGDTLPAGIYRIIINLIYEALELK